MYPRLLSIQDSGVKLDVAGGEGQRDISNVCVHVEMFSVYVWGALDPSHSIGIGESLFG